MRIDPSYTTWTTKEIMDWYRKVLLGIKTDKWLKEATMEQLKEEWRKLID